VPIATYTLQEEGKEEEARKGGCAANSYGAYVNTVLMSGPSSPDLRIMMLTV
jgi:hypothetical protein